MGVKTTRRLLSVMIALIMVLTSVSAVFAAGSPDKGKQYDLKTYGAAKKGTDKVATYLKVVTEAKVSDIKYSINGGKYKTATSKKITGLKEGKTVIVKTGKKYKNYRWMKTTKASQKKKGAKVTWKKIKGATGYVVVINTKNGKTINKTVGKNVTSYKAPKGSKVRVRPLKKKNGHVYMGILSTTVKVK
jgi:NifU-like protein involved in Fe-S cluster formation